MAKKLSDGIVTAIITGIFTIVAACITLLPNSCNKNGSNASQVVIVKGLIVDEKDNGPIPYAIIMVIGTETSTQTGPDGKFEIDLKDYSKKTISLRVTKKGYVDYGPVSKEVDDFIILQLSKQ